jgi:hypothetical protein
VIHFRSGIYATDFDGDDPSLVLGEVLIDWGGLSWLGGCNVNFAIEIAATYSLGLESVIDHRRRRVPNNPVAQLQVLAKERSGSSWIEVSNEMYDFEKVHLFCWELVRRSQTQRTVDDCARQTWDVLARP